MEFSNRRLLLKFAIWQAAQDAEQFSERFAEWLFGGPKPEHDWFIVRVSIFFEEIMNAPPTRAEEPSSAGESLLQMVAQLEDAAYETQQYALLYYAIGIGLSLIGTDEDDDEPGAGVPVLPVMPPKVRAAHERMPNEDETTAEH